MSMLEDLESRFGRGEAIFFTRERGNLMCANLRTPRGAAAQLLLNGGQLVSWRPTEGREALFVASKAVFERGKAVRGGVPVVFPQFGPGPLVNHGFARTAEWTVVGSSEVPGGVSITISLADSPETRAVWPHRFRLDLTVTLTETLSMELWIENPDDHPWSFSSLLHTYLNVTDVSGVEVRGLEGLSFIDKVRDGAIGIERGETLPIDRFIDRVYRDAPDRVVVDDGARRIVVSKDNFRDVVVWNPWSDKTPSFGDLGMDDYTRFVCVEVGNVGEPVTIPAGERVVSAQTLAVEA